MLLLEERQAADRFLASYLPLRRQEGWTDENGVEDPDQGGKRHWRNRRRAAARAAGILRDGLEPTPPPLIADVGAGGGWLARLLPFAAVAAADLAEPPVTGGADVRIRADMRHLPFRDGSLDAAVYCASIHYVPIQESLPETARVLRPGGMLVVIESPIYTDIDAAALAGARTSTYFDTAGAPGLTASYHPVAVDVLRDVLAATGFQVERLDPAHRRYGALRMMRGASAFPTLVARRPPSP